MRYAQIYKSNKQKGYVLVPYDTTCKVTMGVIPVSFLGLPMMHVLVVTHLFGCVQIEIIALFLSVALTRLNLRLVAPP